MHALNIFDMHVIYPAYTAQQGGLCFIHFKPVKKNFKKSKNGFSKFSMPESETQ